MGVLSADQVSVFLAVVDQGGFSAAARLLRRNQSAVSYAIANLENQLGVELFDRGGGRPSLTPAGKALLPDARKAAYSLETMRVRANGLARGVEAELAIATDPFCPLDFLATAMGAFALEFPMVRPAIHVELMHNAVNLVLNGICPIGIITHPISSREDFDQFPISQSIEMGPMASPAHPLAHGRRLAREALNEHIQLVLGDVHGLSLGQETGMFSSRTYQTSDLRMHQELLRAGVGWGFAPAHVMAGDLASGRLVRLDIAVWPNGGWMQAPMSAVRHTGAALGPAATWLLNRLSGVAEV